MSTYIASVFHKTHAVMAVAMYESLHPLLPDAQFHFLCLDSESRVMMDKLNLPKVKSFSLKELGNPALFTTQKERNKTEFAMGSKSNFLSYLVHSGNVADEDLLILSDVDIIFYPPIREFIEKEKKDTQYSVFLTPHKFPKEKEHLIPEVGFYNGGFITFRINETSKAIINEWAKQCINWCFLWHDYENGWHTDQMYMDKWKVNYKGVCDLPDKGVNVGTWNVNRYVITEPKAGEFFVDESPLACYHFHGLKMYYDNQKNIKPYPICVFHDTIYKTYTQKLKAAHNKILSTDPNWEYPLAPHPGILRIIKQTIWITLKL